MFQMIFPIILIVLSKVFYNICQKASPANMNPFAGLLVTYLTAALACTVCLFCYHPQEGVLQSFKAGELDKLCVRHHHYRS